jgi:hypothetical protein
MVAGLWRSSSILPRDGLPPVFLGFGAAWDGHGDSFEEAGGVEVGPTSRKRELPADEIFGPAGRPGNNDDVLRLGDRQD